MTNLHNLLEDSVKGKIFEFRGEYYQMLSLWSQKGKIGDDYFEADVFSSDGLYVRTQPVHSDHRREFTYVPNEELPWLQEQLKYTDEELQTTHPVRTRPPGPGAVREISFALHPINKRRS